MSRGREKFRRDLLYDDPVDCGVVTISKDRKVTDETRTISEVHRSPLHLAVYGLFAGHGGATASEICARNFIPTLLDNPALETDPERAIRSAIETIEAFVLAKSELDRAYYGTTLLFVMIFDQYMYIANIGNSRAVLVTQDGMQILTQEHDGSNAEEVARVRNAGGFFQDGKVNNLVHATRSIGYLELKDRKHITFPNRRMVEDIITAKPDIYRRQVSMQDEYLIMATAEVWEYLSNKIIIQAVSDGLKRRDTSVSCARRVAQVALAAGAKGPLTVMVLLFPTDRSGQDKQVYPRRRRSSRPSTLQRHSLNAEQEVRFPQEASTVPAFVRAAQAQEENRVAIQESDPGSFPVGCPSENFVATTASGGSAHFPSGNNTHTTSTPFLSLNVPPSLKECSPAGDSPRRGRRQVQTKNDAKPRLVPAQSTMGVGAPRKDLEVSPNAQPRRRIMERGGAASKPVVVEQQNFDHPMLPEPRAKTAMVRRISELTASGATCCGDSSVADAGNALGDFIDFNTTGPSKVRYKEDGSAQRSRLGFLRDLGRAFVKKR